MYIRFRKSEYSTELRSFSSLLTFGSHNSPSHSAACYLGKVHEVGQKPCPHMRNEATEAKKGELICLKSMDQKRSQTTVPPSGVDKDLGGLPSWADDPPLPRSTRHLSAHIGSRKERAPDIAISQTLAFSPHLDSQCPLSSLPAPSLLGCSHDFDSSRHTVSIALRVRASSVFLH